MSKSTLEQRSRFGALLSSKNGTGEYVTITEKSGEVTSGAIIGYSKGYDIKKGDKIEFRKAGALILKDDGGQAKIEIDDISEIEY